VRAVSEDAMAPCHPNAISLPFTCFAWSGLHLPVAADRRCSGWRFALTGPSTLCWQGQAVLWSLWNQ